MSILEKFITIDNDLSSIGLIRDNYYETYYCTPINSLTFARLGVDGIHFCIIFNDGEEDCDACTVYVVNPMNDEHNVEPIAENFKSFLSLVITTKDAGALECISYMTKDSFNKYLKTIDSSDIEKQNVIDTLKKTFDLQEQSDVYGYVQGLQRVNKLKEIHYSDEYYNVRGLER